MHKIDQIDNSDTEPESNPTNSIEGRTLRLISLTDIIRKEMEANDDLNASLTLKKDLESAIKELTESYLKEKKFSETFIKREDFQQYLQNSPSGKVKESDLSTSSDENTNEIVVEVGTSSDDDDGKFQKLEKRLTVVEDKLNKIYHILTSKNTGTHIEEKCDSSTKSSKNFDNKESKRNIYDEMFYEWRENTMNSKFYKKSEETLKLNKRPAGNQFVPPPSIADMFPLSSERQLNRPMFIKAVLRKDIKESRFMNQKL